jgi:aminoglycoside phosphotransferase (APT) family kinase protein
VHGTLYDRHVLDAGDGPGVIDWQRFGQGPLELDAGVFLATVARHGLRDEATAREAARAEQALHEGSAGVLEPRALAWYRAAALLQLARRRLRRRTAADTDPLLELAARHAPRQ